MILKLKNTISKISLFPLAKKGLKYLINYKDIGNFQPLCTVVPKMNGCRKFFNETKYMYFLKKDDEFLEKYKKVRDKISNSIKK